MEIDELLCKFQGKEWNGPKSGCDAADYYKEPEEWGNPDFSDDHTAMELLRWFQEEKWEMWNRFEDFCHDKWGFQDGGYDIFVKEWNSISIYLKWLHKLIPADSKPYMRWVVLLAEWLRLEETREKWGWEECPNCEQGYAIRKVGDRMEGTTDRCQYCSGSGKIRAEWAREEG
jgi:hypothetical protein